MTRVAIRFRTGHHQNGNKCVYKRQTEGKKISVLLTEKKQQHLCALLNSSYLITFRLLMQTLKMFEPSCAPQTAPQKTGFHLNDKIKS